MYLTRLTLACLVLARSIPPENVVVNALDDPEYAALNTIDVTATTGTASSLSLQAGVDITFGPDTDLTMDVEAEVGVCDEIAAGN